MTPAKSSRARCFGHGLSFTTFDYSPLTLSDAADGDAVKVTVDVTNIGHRTGSEVVQVYVQPLDTTVERPDRELKGFAKLTLAPGETTTATIDLDKRSFAYWDESTHAWQAPAGAYEILVGSSSRAIHQSSTWTCV